jgi:hypothetical protein
MEEVHQRAIREGRQGEGQQEDYDADHAQNQATGV